MKNILVTGGRGFLGRNLAAHLRERKDCEIAIFTRDNSEGDFQEMLLKADVVFHLAGVNRPKDPADFTEANARLTERMCDLLLENGRSPKVVFSSSIQAESENAYGISKGRGERALRQFSVKSGACVRIYRLANLFGKWSRPNYNSVTATFCHNIANDLPIALFDPARRLDLSYVDDVVAAFLSEIDQRQRESEAGAEIPRYRIQVAELAGRSRPSMRCEPRSWRPTFPSGSTGLLCDLLIVSSPGCATQRTGDQIGCPRQLSRIH